MGLCGNFAETLLESGKSTKVHVNVDPSYPRVFTSCSTGGCARSLGDIYVLLSFISEAFSSINKLKRVHFLVMAFIIIKPCLCLRRFETLFCKLKLGSFKLYLKWLLFPTDLWMYFHCSENRDTNFSAVSLQGFSKEAPSGLAWIPF